MAKGVGPRRRAGGLDKRRLLQRGQCCVCSAVGWPSLIAFRPLAPTPPVSSPHPVLRVCPQDAAPQRLLGGLHRPPPGRRRLQQPAPQRPAGGGLHVGLVRGAAGGCARVCCPCVCCVHVCAARCTCCLPVRHAGSVPAAILQRGSSSPPPHPTPHPTHTPPHPTHTPATCLPPVHLYNPIHAHQHLQALDPERGLPAQGRRQAGSGARRWGQRQGEEGLAAYACAPPAVA